MSEFTLGLNTSTIRPTPLLQKIKVAAAAGFRAIEPWNDEVDEHLARGGTLAEVRRAMDDAGLEVVSMIALGGWLSSDEHALKQALDECRRRMDQAAALGCRSVVASPPQEVVDLDLAAERFGALMRLGRQAGVKPSMEFLGFVDGVNTVAQALAIADLCGEPGTTVVADVFHMIRGGGSVDDLLLLRGDRISCFHINDVPAVPDPRTQADEDRVMLGDGVADLPRVLANLRAIDYRGPLTLELFNPLLWAEDPAAVAALGMERLQALVG